MNDPAGMADERFVTVAEAAALLGLSERQVRRYAGRLAPDDRREPDTMTGSGRTQAGRLRLSALVAAAGKGPQEPDTGRTHDRPTPDASRTPDRQEPDTSQSADGALVDQLRSEVEFLRTLTERQAETIAETVAALRAEQSRSSVLLAAAAQGRLSLPQGESAATTADPGREGQSAAPEGRDGSTRRTEAAGAPRASWWARLWGKV